MGRSNYSTNGLLNAVTKRAFNRYTPTTVDYQHLEAATTTSGLVSNRREYSSALLLADKFSLSPLNLAQANYDPFLKSILSTDWEDTLKELSGESGFNTGLDISLTSDGTKLAVITRDKQTIYLNEGNTEIKVYNYDSTRYDLASPENVATHTYQSVSYTISGIDSTDDGHQVVAVLNDQALQKFSLSETNVLTSDTRFSFGPLGGTGDLTVNLSHDGKRVFVFQPDGPFRVYDYPNLSSGYYTGVGKSQGFMSKDGSRVVTLDSSYANDAGIHSYDIPKASPVGVVNLEKLPRFQGPNLWSWDRFTILALSNDGKVMLIKHQYIIIVITWNGVGYATIDSGNNKIVMPSPLGNHYNKGDISRDGTYVIVGGYGASGAPVKTFKWDPSAETYNEYGGTTLYAVNNADSISINQNGDKAVIGTNTNTSQIYTLADGTWNRRTTVSGTSGEGKVGCVRVANDGRAFATASDSRITFFGDFTNKQYPVGWTQRGNTVSIPSYVKSIALSDDGNYLIAGLYKESTTFFAGIQANAGKVRVYGLSGSTWSQRGADIEYDTANTFFGSAVAISPDGSKFAAGGNGIVRVFKNEVGTNLANLKNTISSIPLTPQSSLLEMNADGSRLVVNRTIFDNAVAKGGVDSADALNLSNDGNYLAVEANNTASLYGINSQGVVSLVGTNILPTDSTAHVGNYRTNTANASTKINVNAANSQLLNLASSYGTTTEICSLTYDPTIETTQRTTTNRILTTESSEITGFASHDGIVISRDGGTLAVYDNAKFSIYNYTNSAWTFVRTKTVTSGPYLVVLSHDGSRVAYRDGSLKVENALTGASLGSISVASLYTYTFKSNTSLTLLQGTNDIELYDYDGTNWILGETVTYSGTNSSTSLLWSGDGTRLAAGDSGSNRRVAFFEYDSTLAAPVFSFVQEGSAHTASLQALSGTGDVKVLGTSTGVEIHEASGTTTFTGGAATSIDVSIDGTRVVVGTSSKMYVVHRSAGVWTQLGSDITGNAPRVAISRDGSKIFSNDLVLKSYEYVSGSWTTYLPDLTVSGITKASTDGDIVAVGTNVYSKQSVTTNAGYTFNASGSTFSGTEQAVSGNGNVRVVADKSVNNGTGQALIYEKVGGSWSSTASATFTGASFTEEFGRDVDVSNDGTRVVIGSGTKMVVVEKSGGTWSQLGSDIAGSTTKVAISRDGSKVFAYSGSDMKSYEYVSGSWTQYLPDLTGLSSITRLAPSTDGDIVALSKNNANQVYSKQSVTATAGYTISQPVATFQEPGGSVISNNGLVAVTYDNSSIGEVKIFEKDSGGNWPSTASATYTGNNAGDYLGRVLGVSDDGTRVAMQSTSKMRVVDKPSAATTTYTVTVASVGGGNRYHIDGVDRASLTLYRGNTYVFDLSDASNNGHPLVFSPTTTGVVDNYSTNSPGTTGSQVTFTVPANAPSSMTYLCQTHGSGMGSTITVSDRVWTQLGSDITASFNDITGSCMSGDGTKVFGISANASGSDVHSWEYSGSSWSQYRYPKATSYSSIGRISHSTNGEILGIEDINWGEVVIFSTTSSSSSYSERHVNDYYYVGKYHSLSNDGANLVYNTKSMVWNGSDYVYDGASGTQVPWYTTSSPSFVEISRNGNFVFWVDNGTNNLRIYSKSTVNGNVQWTLSTSLAYTDSITSMSPLRGDAIIVAGYFSYEKIYDITYTAGSTTIEYATRGSSFSGTQIDMSDDGSKVVGWISSGSMTWNGSTDYAYDGSGGTQVPWYGSTVTGSIGNIADWEMAHNIRISGDGTRVVAASSFGSVGGGSTTFLRMWFKSGSSWVDTGVTMLEINGVNTVDVSLNTDGTFFGIDESTQVKFFDVIYNAGSTSDQYVIRGSGLGSGSNHDLSDDGDYVVYTNVSPGTKAWNGSSWAYNGPGATNAGWSSNHTVLALSGDATKAIAFKSTTNEVILYTKDAQHEWSQNTTLTQAGVTALSIDTDGSIVGVVANSQTKFYTFGSTQSPIGWYSHSSFQDTAEPGFAQSFDISNDGDAVVVGVSGDGTSSYRGAVRVYDYTSSWALRSTITPPSETAANGNVGYRNFGKSVSVSSDGTKIAYLGDQGIYSSSDDWTQLGSDIDGEAQYDQFGYPVSMSSDGTRVAISAQYNDGNGSNAGHVRVYSESGGAWTQVGADIDGEASNDNSGTSVSMSSDGTRVAIGATGNDGNGTSAGHVRVYAESGGTWTQVGTDIDGEATYDYSGTSVSMSSDGTRMAIGALYNDGTDSNAGHVRVYSESGGAWTQVGADIDGEAYNDQSGISVSMSSDGTRVAIGAKYNDGTGSNAGHVRVYSESGGTWTQVGSDIDGEAANDYSGTSVSMSSDGTRVAIGAYGNDGTGSAAGHVRVYSESGGTWTQVGSDIDGEAANDYSGWSVSMSSDGTRVAIGAYGNDGTGSTAGHVRVYSESGGTWTQVGQDIDGEAANDYSGRSVSISSDGTRVAIGAPLNDGNGSSSGHVRVYSFLPPTMTPNRSEASTRDWQNSAWVNPVYASDEVTQVEIVPVSEDRDLETVSMSYDGTRFGVRASSGSYDAIVKKLNTLVITTTDILGWTKRGDIISFDTTDSVAATTSRSMRSSVDGNTVAFGYVNSSGVKIRVYSFASGSWSQLGSEISTTGTTISMDVSNDGTRVAVLSGDTGRVFTYGGGSWSQFGSSIAFRPTGVNTIKISGNGNYVALGNNTPSDPYPFNILRVYKKNVDWELISPTMTLAKTPSNFFGAGFGLLNDGSRLVHYTDSGVEFASFITTTGTDFTQHSTDITGNGVGSNLAFDNSGSTLVTSSFTDNVIRVYDSSHNQVTTFDVKIMYADIEQPFGSPDAMETKPFAITKDGTKIVTVAPPGVSGLRAIVYKKQNGVWSQEGNTIEITVTDRISSVDITNDGNTVIVGSIDEAANGANPCPGRAQAFTLSNGTWSQLGGTITNPEGNHRFSNVVAISDIGTIVAAGHYTYNGGRPFGVVKTYESKDEVQDISFGPPIIELIGNSYIRLPLNAIYTELGATVTTQASTVPEIKITGTVQTGIPGVYTLRYECEDNFRKTATPIFRQVEIISAVPTFRIKGELIVYHTKDVLYIDQGIEVFSGYEDGTNFDMFYREPGSDTIIGWGYVNFTPSTEGDWTVYWVDQLVDEHLRTGSLHTRVVRVRERPIITLTGASVIYHRLFDPFVDPGVTITQSSYGFEGTTTVTAVNPNLSGVYTITYTAVDKFGIEATPITRTVEVKARPIINITGNQFYHLINNPVSLPPVTVTTPIGYASDLTPSLQSSNDIDQNTKGDYTIKHSLTDATSGISAEQKSQKFSVGSHGSLTFSKTGTVFTYTRLSLVLYDTAIRTYNIQGDGSWSLYSTLTVPSTPTAMKMTNDGQYLVIGMSSHLTIGITRVYKRNKTFQTGWEQLGFDLFGTDYLGKFGDAVDINADGSRIVVGAPDAGTDLFRAGSVRIYDWSGFLWNQTKVIEGTIPSQSLGFSLSFDDAGTSLAIGSPGHSITTIDGSTVTTTNVGKTSVYKLGASWDLIGSEIEDGPTDKRNGTSVSISSDGKTLAVGSSLGGVRVYKLTTSNTWGLRGSQILSNVGGKSASLVGDGDILAIGSEDEHGGRVYIYTYGGSTWSNATKTFDKVVTADGATLLGKRVVLNNDGTSLCLLTNTEIRIYDV